MLSSLKNKAHQSGIMKMANTIFLICLGVFIPVFTLLANPTGEQVVGGGATFDRNNPNVLNITTGDRAIINWQSFSINQGEMTKFLQSGPGAAVLNRVIGGDSSAIMGALSANGQVFLINPNGIIFGNGAQINTAGFLASTMDVNNENFMAGGDLHFVGDSSAKVVNLGKIQADSGDIVMLARQVENHGQLNAPKGGVYMAAGKEVLLSEKGKDRVFVKTGYNGNSVVGDGVVNKGSINALHADLQAQGNIYAYAINNQGSIHATGVVKEGGRVKLTAGGIGNGAGNIINSGSIMADNSGEILVKGQNVTTTDSSVIQAKTTSTARKSKIKIESEDTTLVSGEINASSDTDKGGSIQITGVKVGAMGLRADASGQTGGGEILLGGDYQGKNPDVKNAQKTTVTADTKLIADAKGNGDGGKVVVWSDDTTKFYGSISARGGVDGGKGGLAEVSGKENLIYRGSTDLRAFDGTAGTLLLDPKNITVSGIPGAVNASYTNTVNNLFVNDPTLDYTFLASDIVSNLNLASMVLQANNDIIIATDVIATNGVFDLTLQAGRSIFIGQASDATIRLGGDFTAIANDNDIFVQTAQRDAGVGGFFMLPGSTIDTSLNAGDISIEVRQGAGAGQTSGNIVLANLNAGAGDVLVTNSGNTAGSSILMVSNNAQIVGNSVNFGINSAGAGSNTTGSIGMSTNPMIVTTSTNGVSAFGQGGGVHLTASRFSGAASTSVNLYVSSVVTTNGGNITLSALQPTTLLYINGPVSNTAGGITTLIADGMIVNTNVVSTDRINVMPANQARMILGSTNFVNGILSLSTSTLSKFITPTLQLGSSNVTSISFQSDITFVPTNVQTLTLKSGGGISSVANILTVSNFAFEANGSVNFGNLAPIGPLVDAYTIAGRVTGAASIAFANAGTNLVIGEVDGYKGLRTQNGSITVEQGNGVLTIAHTVTSPTDYDIDAGNSAVVFSMANPTNGVSSNGFFTLSSGALVRGGSGSISAAQIQINTNALLSIGSGGTLTADRMDIFGRIVAQNTGSEILLNTFTKGGSVSAIAMNGLFGSLLPINNGYPATPVATYTVTTVDGNGSGLSLGYIQTEISPGNNSYDVFLPVTGKGSGYTEAPTITWTPPPGGGITIETQVVSLTDGRAITLGTKGAYVPGAAGALYLNQQDVDNISAGNVRIGDTTSGQISLAGDITISAFDTLSLKTRADIIGTGRITVNNLDLFATKGVALTGENNVNNVTGNLRQNTFTFNNAGSFAVGASGIQTAAAQINISLTTTSGDITLNGPVSSGGGSGSIFIRANNGQFANTSSGTLSAGGSTITIESDTINIGGQISANAGIYLRPNNPASTISINDATANYNLTTTQLMLLDSTGGVEVGRTNGSGAISIGSLGPVNLSSETYNLTVYGGSLTNQGNLTMGPTQQFAAFVDSIAIISNITAQGGITLAPRSDAVGIALNDATGAFSLTATELAQLTTSSVKIGRESGTGPINIGSLGTINLTNANSSFLLFGSGSPVSFNFQNPADTFALSQNQSFTIYTGGSVLNSGLNQTDITIGGPNGTLGIGNFGVLVNSSSTVNLRTSVANLSGARTTGTLTIANNTNLNVQGIVNSLNNNIFLSAANGTLTSSSNGTINAGSASVTLEAGSLNLLKTVTGTNSITLQPYTNNISIGLNDTNGAFRLTAGAFGNLITTNVNIGRVDGIAPIYIGGLGSINLASRDMNVNLLGASSDVVFNFTGNNTLTLRNNKTMVFNTGGNISNPGGSTKDLTIGGVGTVIIQNAKNVAMTTALGRLGGSTNTGSFQLVNNTSGQFAVVGDVLIQGSGAYGTNIISAGQGDLFINSDVTSTNGTLNLLAQNGVQITAGVDINTQGGGLLVNADVDGNGAGQYNQAAGAAVTTGGGTNEIIASDVVILGTINAGAGDIVLRPSLSNTTVNVGNNNGGNFYVNNAELANITSTGKVTIGDRANTTNLISDGANAGALNVRLRSKGNINDNGGAGLNTTGYVVLDAGGSIGSTTTFNINGSPNLTVISEGDGVNVTSGTTLTDLAVKTDGTVTNQSIVDGGNITYNVGENALTTTITNASVAVGSLNFAYTNTGGSIVISNINTGVSGDLAVNAASNITQTLNGVLEIGGNSQFIAAGGSDIILDQTGNDFGGGVSFTNNSPGLLNNISIYDQTGLAIGPLQLTSNLTVVANGITNSGALVVGGLASFDAGAGNDLNLSGFTNQMAGLSIVNANNASVLNNGSLNLAASQVTGNLNVTNLNGTITNTGMLIVGGNSVFVASAGQSVYLGSPLNNFFGTVGFTGLGGNLQNIQLNNLGAINLAALAINGNLAVNSGGAVTQSGAWQGSTLSLTSAGTIVLTNSANNFAALGTVSRGGDFSYTDTGALAINGNINTGNTASDVTIISFGGAISLNAQIAASGIGNDITLVSDVGFINSAGATALSPTAGSRYLVYSVSPLANTLGGLTPVFEQYNLTYPTTPADTVNSGVLYSLASPPPIPPTPPTPTPTPTPSPSPSSSSTAINPNALLLSQFIQNFAFVNEWYSDRLRPKDSRYLADFFGWAQIYSQFNNNMLYNNVAGAGKGKVMAGFSSFNLTSADSYDDMMDEDVRNRKRVRKTSATQTTPPILPDNRSF